MDSNTKRKSLENIWEIWRQVEKCQSTFLSPSDLQAFGIEARQVANTHDGFPQFEPCFFEPHPEEVLRKYPIDVVANEYDVRRLTCVPTLEDALSTIRETTPASEIPLEAAQKLLEEELKEYHSRDGFAHGDWIHNQIEFEHAAYREGGQPLFTIDQFTSIGEWVYVEKEIPTL